MKKIKIVIEKSKDMYSAYAENVERFLLKIPYINDIIAKRIFIGLIRT